MRLIFDSDRQIGLAWSQHFDRLGGKHMFCFTYKYFNYVLTGMEKVLNSRGNKELGTCIPTPMKICKIREITDALLDFVHWIKFQVK